MRSFFIIKSPVSLVFLTILLFGLKVYGQMPSNTAIIPPSPNAASIGKYGEIPLNYSSGLPNVTIPLFNLNEGSIAVPVSLNYNYSGFRPYEQPSVVGKGWSLMAGGLITRVVRGNPDERNGGNAKNGYLASTNYIKSMLNTDGTLNCSGNGCPDCFNQKTCDGQPDMFYFSFGNISGKFFFGDDGLPHIVSDQKIKISYKSFNTSTLIYNGIFDNIFGFTMTTEDGTIYRFGDPAQTLTGFNSLLKNVEFSYSIDEFTNEGANGAFAAVVSAWMLQEVEDVKGNKVNFFYTNDYRQASGGAIDLTRKKIVASPYNYYDIKTHSTTYEAKLNLAISSENFLTKIQGATWKVDFTYNNLTTNNLVQTLNTAILSKNDGTVVKSVEASYSGSDSKCQLLSLKEIAATNINVNKTHVFEYYDLPATFFAYGLDLWGYYNGVNNTNLIPVAPFNSNREPSLTNTVMGALKKITYPTGGASTFEYEQNQFSWIRGSTTNSLIQPFGGLRISKITDIDNQGNPPIEKKYFYNVFNNPSLSSGVILAPPGSNYFTFQETHPESSGGLFTTTGYVTTDWKFYRSDPFISLSQNPVYYFNVSELIGNTLKTDREFTSHIDYPDELGVNYGLGTPEYGPSGSFDFAHSLPKSIRYYRNNDLVKEQLINYNVSVIHRARTLWLEILTAPNTGTFQFAKGLSTISGWVQKTSEVTNDYYPEQVSKTVSYEYDPSYYSIRKQTTATSGNKTITTTLKYPYDIAGTVYTDMVAKNIISPVIEKTVKVDGTVLAFSRTNYDLFNNSLYLPKTTETQIANNPIFTKQIFSNYNVKGNLLEEKQPDGINTSYQWGYNDQYPVVKIINAHNSVTTSTQAGAGTKNISIYLGSNSGNYPNPSTTSFTQNTPGNIILQLSASVPNTSSGISFNYNLTGPSNKSGSFSCSNGNCNLPPGGTITFPNMPQGNYTLSLSGSTSFASYTFQISLSCSYQASVGNTANQNEYFYDGFEENADPAVVIGTAHSGNKFFNGSYTTSFTMPNSRSYFIQWWSFDNNKWIFHEQPFTQNITLTDKIDDVRIFPSDAQMTTYTYSPLVGITSMTDPKGMTTTYEYDSFQRLLNVKDKDGNIVKHNGYHYQNQ